MRLESAWGRKHLKEVCVRLHCRPDIGWEGKARYLKMLQMVA